MLQEEHPVRTFRISDEVWHKMKATKPRGVSWDTLFGYIIDQMGEEYFHRSIENEKNTENKQQYPARRQGIVQ